MRSIRDRKPTENIETGKTEEIDALMKKYSGRSEGELMSELMAKVSSAKRDGSFDAQSLDEFVRLVSPELDEQSRLKLQTLVKTINGERSF